MNTHYNTTTKTPNNNNNIKNNTKLLLLLLLLLLFNIQLSVATNEDPYADEHDPPFLTDTRIELIADHAFEGILLNIKYVDVYADNNNNNNNNNNNKKLKTTRDRHYQFEVLVKRILHLRKKPLMYHYPNPRDIHNLKNPSGEIIKHKHEININEKVHVMMWRVMERPKSQLDDLNNNNNNNKDNFNLDKLGFDLFPDEIGGVYRFITQGFTHRAFLYKKSFPHAGDIYMAVEPLTPNGVLRIERVGETGV